MKLERLMSITFTLLNYEVVSATELADKYKVSPRTIYRDIEAICAAGIPIVSFQGVNGGYGIMDEYKLDKSMLGSYDIESLITLLRNTASVFRDKQALETIHKLQSLQTVQTGEKLPSFSIDFGSWRSYAELLPELRAAITNSCVVHFQYTNSKNEQMRRIVEPVTLVFKFQGWYLYGFCQNRQAYRVFKLARMTELVSRTEQFRVRNHSLPHDLVVGHSDQPTIVGVVLQFSVDAIARALDYFFGEEKVFGEDGTLQITIIQPCQVQWLIQTILSFGDTVKVIEPLSFRQTIQDQIMRMYNLYL